MKPTDWAEVVKRNGFETEDAMWRYYRLEKGWGPTDVARAIGVGILTTRRRLWETGYSPGGYQRVPWERLCQYHGFESEAAMWQDLYVGKKWGGDRIGRLLGLSGFTVQRRRQALGISPHPRGGANGRLEYPGSGRWRLRRSKPEFLATLSIQEIADRLGLNYHSAYEAIRLLGLPFRKLRKGRE